MNDKSFDIYFEFNYFTINTAAFNKLSGKLEYYYEESYKDYISNQHELNFNELQEILEKNIRKIEKSLNIFIKDIYLIIETPLTKTIQLSVIKNNDGNKIIKNDAMYLIQDAKQQILKSVSEMKILHILVEKYVLDNIDYDYLPINKNCKKFSIDTKFICVPKDLLRKFEKLFLNQQVDVNQFLCLKYLKTLNEKDNEKKVCELGQDSVKGMNKQEVLSVPKLFKNKGFFANLFSFFE